jgi:hypothetical protein
LVGIKKCQDLRLGKIIGILEKIGWEVGSQDKILGLEFGIGA